MTQLSCDYVRDVYPDLLSEKVDALRAQQVRAHIATCDVCRAEARVVEMLHVVRTGAPAGLSARVLKEATEPRHQIPGARVPIVAAASIVLALIGGSALLQTRPEPAGGAGFGFVTVENVMLSGKASLNDWSEEDLELLLKEMES